MASVSPREDEEEFSSPRSVLSQVDEEEFLSPQKDEERHMFIGRHEHELCPCEGVPLYKCSGCKEDGINVGFWCPICPGFTLHEKCATLPDDYDHVKFPGDRFHFQAKPPRRGRKCHACREVVRGFMFESRVAHVRLHPLCMDLPPVLNYSGHEEHRLKLIPDNYHKYSCPQCNTMSSDWRYQCERTACRLYIDFKCAKADFHELSDIWNARVQRRSRRKYVLKELKKWGKWFGGRIVEGAVSGLVESAIKQL